MRARADGRIVDTLLREQNSAWVGALNIGIYLMRKSSLNERRALK
jgi:hypothetical protein